MFKFDLVKRTRLLHTITQTVYLSEAVFIPNPNGTKEDDRVLLTQAYFGREQARIRCNKYESDGNDTNQ